MTDYLKDLVAEQVAKGRIVHFCPGTVQNEKVIFLDLVIPEVQRHVIIGTDPAAMLAVLAAEFDKAECKRSITPKTESVPGAAETFNGLSPEEKLRKARAIAVHLERERLTADGYARTGEKPTEWSDVEDPEVDHAKVLEKIAQIAQAGGTVKVGLSTTNHSPGEEPYPGCSCGNPLCKWPGSFHCRKAVP